MATDRQTVTKSGLCPHRVPRDAFCKRCADPHNGVSGPPRAIGHLPAARATDLAALPDPETAALGLIERGRSAIAEAQTLEDAKGVFAQTKVLEAATRAVKLTRETIVAASAVRVRAERRVGQLLAAEPKQAGARGVGKRPAKVESAERTPLPPTLADLGIGKNESAQAQRLAAIPEETFEKAVAAAQEEALETSGHVTTGAVLRKADPEAADPAGEDWVEADRFVQRCAALADDSEKWLAPGSGAFGGYPGAQELLGCLARLRDVLAVIYTDIEGRTP